MRGVTTKLTLAIHPLGAFISILGNRLGQLGMPNDIVKKKTPKTIILAVAN